MSYNIIPLPRDIKLKDGFCDINKAKVATKLAEGYAAEGYRIDIDERSVLLTASTEAGLFYAKVSLDALRRSGRVRCGTIEDEPLYGYRGYMLDCSRHFFDIKEVRRLIDVCAQLKLNIFHWHLCDDQGFRLQSDKFPLLNEIGSHRTDTRGDGVPVSGYYTKQQIADIVAYAAERHIQIIPEIDIPGHFGSLIASYPHLSCSGEKIPVPNYFGIMANLICAGKQTSYDFLFALLDEVFEMFPCKYIHLGGDEAVKLPWIKCPDCQKKLTELGLEDEEQLQSYFMTVMVDYCRKKGKTVINWNDGLMAGGLPTDMIAHYWKSTGGCREVCVREVNKGMNVILSPFFFFYLDYPYRMTRLSKTYSFDEMEIGFDDPSRIMGIEAPLWTEYVENINQAHTQTFPRLIAAAELAWTMRDKRDYASFLKRLPAFFAYLDSVGIGYTDVKNSDVKGLRGTRKLVKFIRNAARYNASRNIEVSKANKAALKEKYGK